MKGQGFFLLFIIAALFCSVKDPRARESDNTDVIGFYTAGCIRNASALPAEGTGYQVIRLSRKRYFGHPDLVQYIESLARKVSSHLTGVLLVGDLSMQKGGPLPDDHNSHQTGLDADILFWQHPVAVKRTLSQTEREKIAPVSLLKSGLAAIDESKWDFIDGEILKLAASYKNVDRIFVNPVIKKRVCETYPGEDWLRKLRPWWGHDGHFHVRLRCPPDSPLCQSQEPVSSGDGCGADLDAWFTKRGLEEKARSSPRTPRALPIQCVTLLAE